MSIKALFLFILCSSMLAFGEEPSPTVVIPPVPETIDQLTGVPVQDKLIDVKDIGTGIVIIGRSGLPIFKEFEIEGLVFEVTDRHPADHQRFFVRIRSLNGIVKKPEITLKVWGLKEKDLEEKPLNKWLRMTVFEDGDFTHHNPLPFPGPDLGSGQEKDREEMDLRRQALFTGIVILEATELEDTKSDQPEK